MWSKVLLLSICSIFLFIGCKTKNDNEANINLIGLVSSNPFFLGEIDTDITTSCGTASPATSSTTTTGTTTPTSTSSTSTTSTKFSIVSILTFKTKETLSIRYTYDYMQTKGTINTQQGFILTGGAFAKTATGTLGSVSWSAAGININTSLTTSQEIPSFEISLNLNGYATDSSSSTSTSTCPTLDNVNCTAATTTTTTTCYTINNQTCYIAASGNGTPITISGTIKCNAPNVVAQ
ncbi:LIC10920 family plasminogen-binding lipoprotein [Leptospira sp. 'Mane']|uniref:LIC10920 family plasminogen-binding lipoprotein n=1 Tax=Leptospira sp. 'Mane' TaxID=3387407 RepID=UPI00398B38CE